MNETSLPAHVVSVWRPDGDTYIAIIGIVVTFVVGGIATFGVWIAWREHRRKRQAAQEKQHDVRTSAWPD
jgi:hypothetical protein